MDLRSPIVVAVVAVLLYYAFLRHRMVIDGRPWAPVPVQAGPRSAAA